MPRKMHDHPMNYSSVTVVLFPNGHKELNLKAGDWLHYYNYDPDDDTINGAMQRYLVYGEPTEILAHYDLAGVHEDEVVNIHDPIVGIRRAEEWMEKNGFSLPE